MTRDEKYMRLALEQANEALLLNEIPVGAIILHGDTVVGTGFNRREKDRDPIAHAEIIALRKAAQAIGDWRLDGFEMFCTLEPCAMCAGAILNSRIKRLVFGAFDTSDGFFGGNVDITSLYMNKSHVEVLGGVLQEECTELLKRFFIERR